MSERSNEEKPAAETRIRILTACSDAVIWTYSVGGKHAHALGDPPGWSSVPAGWVECAQLWGARHTIGSGSPGAVRHLGEPPSITGLEQRWRGREM